MLAILVYGFIAGDSYVLYLLKSTKGTYINAITVDVSLLASSFDNI